MTNHPWKGCGQGHMTLFEFCGSSQISDFVHKQVRSSVHLGMTNYPVLGVVNVTWPFFYNFWALVMSLEWLLKLGASNWCSYWFWQVLVHAWWIPEGMCSGDNGRPTLNYMWFIELSPKPMTLCDLEGHFLPPIPQKYSILALHPRASGAWSRHASGTRSAAVAGR